MNFSDWLNTRSVECVRDILGPERAAQFVRGDLDMPSVIASELREASAIDLADEDHKLTKAEIATMDALSTAVARFTELPQDHPTDAADFADAIHVAQRIVMKRLAARAHPEIFGASRQGLGPDSLEVADEEQEETLVCGPFPTVFYRRGVFGADGITIGEIIVEQMETLGYGPRCDGRFPTSSRLENGYEIHVPKVGPCAYLARVDGNTLYLRARPDHRCAGIPVLEALTHAAKNATGARFS